MRFYRGYCQRNLVMEGEQIMTCCPGNDKTPCGVNDLRERCQGCREKPEEHKVVPALPPLNSLPPFPGVPPNSPVPPVAEQPHFTEIKLSRTEATRFVEAIASPPPANAALKTLLKPVNTPPPSGSLPAFPEPVKQEVQETRKPSLTPGFLSELIKEEVTDIDIDSILSNVEGLLGGPSKGGLSWHTLANAATCWRKAYLCHVMGLSSRRKSLPLLHGTLLHACLEMHFRTGGAKTFAPVDAVHRAGLIDLAADVRKWTHVYLRKYAAEQASSWDIRAVEANAVWFQVHKLGAKHVVVPVSCRHDLLYSKMRPGDTRAPYGSHPPNGTKILDFKTSGRITRELVSGYSMDPQFLTNCLVYENSHELELYGPLAGVTVDLIVKHKEPDPDKSIQRVDTAVLRDSMIEFAEDELKPLALEMYRRLSTPTIREEPRCWPKNRNACVGRYGLCNFFDVCNSEGIGAGRMNESVIDTEFKVNEERIIKVENFAEPPEGTLNRLKVLRSTETEAEAKPKKVSDRVAKKRAFELIALASIARHLNLAPGNYICSTKKVAVTAVAEDLPGVLKAYCEDLSAQKALDLQLSISPDGKKLIVSSLADEGKITCNFTWKKIAETITADWWDYETLGVSSTQQARFDDNGEIEF